MLFINVAAGIALVSQASPMVQESLIQEFAFSTQMVFFR